MANYQVFISYKNAEPDVVMAEALYQEMKRRNISAFFSKYSIDESARADYVDVIDEALDSALLLVAVGASKKNLTSKWVKAEINQFRTLMNSEEEEGRTLASFRAEDYPEKELPSGLKSYQSFTDINALVRFIEAFFNKNSAFRQEEAMTSLLNSTAKNLGSAGCGNSVERISAKNEAFKEKGLQVGELLNGRYRLLSQIGQGGMSVVYLAMDEKTNNQLAVKEFRDRNISDSAALLSSFRCEAEMMISLKHSAIPKIYDVIDTQDSMILVMDFIDGLSLRQILAKSGPMNEATAINYARQLCEVLTYLHTRPTPIIYRDIKPDNVIVLPDGSIKLIDFGIARYYSAEPKNQDTTCLGTIGYAAPEQYGGAGQSDARTDIYNLGTTLYHLVTGKSPAEPPYEILPIRQVNPKLSRGLQAIIFKCTQRDPKQRFQSAAELLCALENMRKFVLGERLRSPFGRSSEKNSRAKTSRAVPQKSAAPIQPRLQTLIRPESLSETTVLQPSEDAGTVQSDQNAPIGGQILPSASKSLTVPMPQVVPSPVDREGFRIPGASPLPAQPNPNALLNETCQKFEALDPDAQRIVRELIDRLSK